MRKIIKSMKYNRTFKEIAAAVLDAPDFRVELSDLVIGSTHLFTEEQISTIRIACACGVDPNKIPEAITAKNRLLEVLEEIEAGRTKPAMNVTLKICK